MDSKQPGNDLRQENSEAIGVKADQEEIDEITDLKQELENQKQLVQKNHELYLRALAEAENTRKRAVRDKEEYVKYAALPLINRLLPIVDNLDRALQMTASDQGVEALSKGMEMIARDFKEALEAEGLKDIEALGQPFDPEFHQPLTVEENDQYPENTVIEELQKGYIFHGRVIRPSLVKVSKSK